MCDVSPRDRRLAGEQEHGHPFSQQTAAFPSVDKAAVVPRKTHSMWLQAGMRAASPLPPALVLVCMRG